MVPEGTTLVVAREFAEKICSCGPLAIKAVTQALRNLQENFSEEEAMEASDKLAGPVFSSEDAKEGMGAFKEKRNPIFRGK